MNRGTAARLCTLLLGGWTAYSQSAPPAPHDAGTLRLRLSVDRVLAHGETDAFHIDAAAGQFVQVTVQKKGLDVAIRVTNPAGMLILTADSPNFASGPVSASWIAQDPGNYGVQVAEQSKSTAANGHYEIELKEMRAPQPADQERIQAEAKLADAVAKDRAGGRENRLAAVKLYLETAPAWAKLGAVYQQVICLHRAGSIYSELSDQPKAIETFQQELAVQQAANDRAGQGVALTNIGVAEYQLGDSLKAMETFQQALTIQHDTGNLADEAATLSYVGYIYSSVGDPQKSLEAYQKALAIWRSLGNRLRESQTLSNIAGTYRDLGGEDKALDYFQQALTIQQAAGEQSAAGATMSGFGDVYFFIGEKQKALDAYQKSLDLKRAAKERSGEAEAMIGLGNVYSNLGGRQKVSAPTPAEQQKAMDYYQQALAIGKEVNDPFVNVLGSMGAGVLYSAMGDKQKALEYINQALVIFRFVRYQPYESWGLYEKARVERDLNHLPEALAAITSAREIAETIRANTPGQELRAAFFDVVHDGLQLEIEILMRLAAAQGNAAAPARNYQAEAFAASERARARVLLETLAESFHDIRAGVDPALLERERSLQGQFHAKDMARIQMMASNPFSSQVAAADKAARELSDQLEQTRAEIRAKSPKYAELTSPQPLTLGEIQQQVLDPGTVLLEFALGDERSFGWTVSSSGITASTLPARKEIEQSAKQFYEALTAQNAAATAQAGKALSRMLLGDGAALEKKRLLIVADGALQYMPFGAMPDPAAGGQPLVVNHEIVSMPSASTLAVLRRENANRKPAPKALAVLADPVFSADDSRLARLREAAAAREPAAPLKRSMDDVGLRGRLARLPGTRREAAGIVSLVPAADRKQALDFDASRTTLLSPEMGQYRMLHLATHGLLNSAHPDLSGVVLSLVDRQGKPVDGFLRLHEIYNLKLAADLVVLSACQTGLGQDVRGEGLIGLTRGFMYAGAPRVVASLWKVDDRATAELMQRFYRAILGDEHLTPAAALRQAQISMRQTKGFEDPYYWAAFTLQGEWR